MMGAYRRAIQFLQVLENMRRVDEMRVNEPTEFTVGQTVRLKCGGPIMVVARIVDLNCSQATGRDIGIHCDWHDNEDRPHTASYAEDQLTKVWA